MANTIKMAMRLQIVRDNVTIANPPLKEVSTVTTSELRTDNVQIVGTTHEVIAAGDVTDAAACRIENLHATAMVEVGIDDASVFVPLFKIPAGGPPAILPMLSVAANVYLKSSVASTPVRVLLCKLVDPV
jgi:hypothetical protein